MNDNQRSNDSAGLQIRRKPANSDVVRIQGIFHVEVMRDGEKVWEIEQPNIITDIGVQELFSVALDNGTQADPWYVGLISGASPTVGATDTWATKTWTEFTNSTEGRIAWGGTGGTATVPNGSASNPTRNMSNLGSAVTFNITGSGTIGGVFIIASASGTGTLFAHTSIAGGPTVANGDDVLVTYTAIIN